MKYLITGGTGSMGKRLARHILDTRDPHKVIIYSRNEYNQVMMQREFNDSRMRYRLGDICDEQRTIDAFADADVVIHTAALKHVDKAQADPLPYLRVNVQGTENVLRACQRRAKRCVLLNTDKSVMPINFYGLSKAVAEYLFLHWCHYSNVYNVVRYGNIMESRGSVLHKWAEAKREGRGLTVTDGGMSRFAVSFDLALHMIDLAIDGHPQLVYVPKAPSFRLWELANAFDPRWLPAGLRPGEKLDEQMIHRYEVRRTHDMGDHYEIRPEIPADDEYPYPEGKRTLPDEGYSSDNNTDWLSRDDLRKIAEGI